MSALPPVTWLPPPLETLNFATNCDLVTEYLGAWFDISSSPNLINRLGSGQSAAFYLPETLDTTSTESYFRLALPPDTQSAPLYGEILQWELFLRRNTSVALQEWQNATTLSNNSTTSPPIPPYFAIAIDQPARVCKSQTCRLSFDTTRLAGINGPGMFIFYYVQCVIATFCASIIILGALCLKDRTNSAHGRRDPTGIRKWFTILFTAVKDRYDGISVAAATFSLVLPAAIVVHFWVSSPRIFSYKDTLLELWVITYSTTFSVWLYRMGACLRRQDKMSVRCPLCGEGRFHEPAKKSAKPTLPAAIIISVASLGLCGLTVFYIIVNRSKNQYQPFHLEEFWDEVCEFEYGTTVMQLGIAGASLLAYCLLRLLSRCRWNDKSGQGSNTASTLGVLDVVILMLMSWGFLGCYTWYRLRLLVLVGANNMFGGWNLGQVFAISSLLSLPLMFLMSAFRARRKTEESGSRNSSQVYLLSSQSDPDEQSRRNKRSSQVSSSTVGYGPRSPAYPYPGAGYGYGSQDYDLGTRY